MVRFNGWTKPKAPEHRIELWSPDYKTGIICHYTIRAEIGDREFLHSTPSLEERPSTLIFNPIKDNKRTAGWRKRGPDRRT